MLYHLPILIIISPFTIALFILVFKRYIITLSIVSILFSFISLLLFTPSILNGQVITYHLGGWPGPLGISLIIDGLSFFFAFIVLLVLILVTIYSSPEKEYNHIFYFLILLLQGSMLGTIFTADIFNIYILYELVSIATYLLIAYYQHGVSLRASFNYLLMSAVGLSLFLLAVGSLYAMTGTLHIQAITKQIPSIFTYNPQIIIISMVLIITCMGIKMAMFPLHAWLPNAHSLAPSPVSAILSGIVVKVGVYCLARLLYGIFGSEKLLIIGSQHILMILSAITLIFGAVMALAQIDLKRMLAYSTITQIGIILIGLSINSNKGFEGAFFHVLNHAILKSALFCCAGIIIQQTGSRRIPELNGFARKNPQLAFCFIILSLGIIGIPPMNGFVSKFLICLAAIESGHSILAVAIIFSSIITAAYFFRVIQVFYSDSFQVVESFNNMNIPESFLGRNNFFKLGPIFILTGLSLVLGIIPSLGIYLIKPGIMTLLSTITQ